MTQLSQQLQDELINYNPVWVAINRNELESYLKTTSPTVSLLEYCKKNKSPNASRVFFIADQPSDLDLRALDLRNRNFSDCVFNHCLFAKSFENSKWSNSYLRESDLSRVSSAENTEFESASLELLRAPGVNFSNSNVINAKLEYADLSGADLSGCATAYFPQAILKDIKVDPLYKIEQRLQEHRLLLEQERHEHRQQLEQERQAHKQQIEQFQRQLQQVAPTPKAAQSVPDTTSTAISQPRFFQAAVPKDKPAASSLSTTHLASQQQPPIRVSSEIEDKLASLSKNALELVHIFSWLSDENNAIGLRFFGDELNEENEAVLAELLDAKLLSYNAGYLKICPFTKSFVQQNQNMDERIALFEALIEQLSLYREDEMLDGLDDGSSVIPAIRTFAGHVRKNLLLINQQVVTHGLGKGSENLRNSWRALRDCDSALETILTSIDSRLADSSKQKFRPL